jgi:uncharacterized pyridoxal phosphate-containing UPF0001 family protein
MPLLEKTLIRYHGITHHIESAHKKTPLAHTQVKLVAITKAHPAEAILPLLQAGSGV